MIAYGETRELARQLLIDSLKETIIQGIVTNVNVLLQILETDVFIQGRLTTTYLANKTFESHSFEVVDQGL